MGTTIRRWGRRKMPVQDRSRAMVGYVLEAAAQLFGELGYEGTTTNRVAERAGVSIGSVYQYFPNKEALLLALAERHLEEARQEATATLRHLREERLSPEEFFRGFVEFVVDFHQGGESLHSLFFEEAPRSRRLLELVGAINAACATEIENYLRGIGLGGADLALKSMMLANIVGMLAHDEVLDPPPGYTSEAYAEEIVTACLGYLGRSVERFGDA
jgi:AcrR family transcriptional regulator